MSEILEIIMIVSFGASWPLNVWKSYRAKTTQGKSLAFLCLIFFGYIAGILSLSLIHISCCRRQQRQSLSYRSGPLTHQVRLCHDINLLVM